MICDRCIHWVVCKNEDYDIKECGEFFELIKCKDCKHREEYKIFGRPTAYYCSRGCVDSNLLIDENDYCCWGERRETNK